MNILEVQDVSTRYITGDFKDIGLNEYILRKMKGNYRVNEFWVDRNISFSLEKGDMLGLIDRPFKQLSSGMKSRLVISIASLV